MRTQLTVWWLYFPKVGSPPPPTVLVASPTIDLDPFLLWQNEKLPSLLFEFCTNPQNCSRLMLSGAAYRLLAVHLVTFPQATILQLPTLFTKEATETAWSQGHPS